MRTVVLTCRERFDIVVTFEERVQQQLMSGECLLFIQL